MPPKLARPPSPKFSSDWPDDIRTSPGWQKTPSPHKKWTQKTFPSTSTRDSTLDFTHPSLDAVVRRALVDDQGVGVGAEIEAEGFGSVLVQEPEEDADGWATESVSESLAESEPQDAESEPQDAESKPQDAESEPQDAESLNHHAESLNHTDQQTENQTQKFGTSNILASNMPAIVAFSDKTPVFGMGTSAPSFSNLAPSTVNIFATDSRTDFTPAKTAFPVQVSQTPYRHLQELAFNKNDAQPKLLFPQADKTPMSILKQLSKTSALDQGQRLFEADSSPSLSTHSSIPSSDDDEFIQELKQDPFIAKKDLRQALKLVK